MSFGVDSISEIPIWVHHEIGSTFAMRYLSHSSWKTVTSSEYSDYKKAGLYLGLVFEDGATNALLGYDQGRADAEFARRQAVDILGEPESSDWTIFAAVDSDPAGFRGGASATDGYFDGWAAVLGREHCAPYGAYSVVVHQHGRGFAKGWQTVAWSYGENALGNQAVVYQSSINHTVAGQGVDFDRDTEEKGFFWNGKKPGMIDPYHYERFVGGPFKTRWGVIHERLVVESYDHLRKHPFQHRRRLGLLRQQLRYLANRVAYEAFSDGGKRRPRRPGKWNAYHRGWRYQELLKRSEGHRIAK
jgi:hypothetical protein